jgi:subtilase family serine protease
MRISRAATLLLLAIATVFALPAVAQRFAPTVRIVDRIDESNLVTLKGNTHPAASAKNDLGAVRADLPMTDLILVLSRDPAQQAAFEKFVAAQYDSTSPFFHQWLTPEQVGENFGPSPTDIATITQWLTGRGFSVTQVTNDRMTIRFNGTAAQVQSAFHTEIHNLQVKGVNHIGNMSDPKIPAALAQVVVGVKALHNFFPKPAHHLGSMVQRDASTGKWMRVAATAAANAPGSRSGFAPSLGLQEKPKAEAKASPMFGATPSSGGTTYLVEDLAPYDFNTIYNILPLWNAGIDGTGQTIAIAGTSDIDVGQTGETGANGNNDVATFRNAFGLPTNLAANTPKRVSGSISGQPLTVCTDTTGTIPYSSNACEADDLIENSLDVEWSASIAKNAQIVLVSTYPASVTDDNLYDSESYIVENINNPSSPVYGARIMNVSYGECELGNGTAGNVEYYDLWQSAAAEGISVFVAAGDSGSASCDDGFAWAASGLTVSGLASTPYNTAVGGTDLNWCNPDTANGSAGTQCSASPYWNSTNNATTGASVSTSGPGLGYVLEVPWNESCANPITLKWVQDAANYIYGYSSTQISNVEQACNFIFDYDYTGYQYGAYGLGTTYPYLENLLAVVGGSGGASGCVVGSAVTSSSTGEMTGCTAGATSTGATTNPSTNTAQAALTVYPTSTGSGWPKPIWQQSSTNSIPGLLSDGVRDMPDVSFFAADGYVSSSAYLICVTQEGSCSYSSLQEPFAQEVGGTSVATPAMAGVMALINQKAGSAQGLATPGLYALAAKQTYSECSAETVKTSSSCYFNDIDQYTIAQPCDAADSTPNCTASSTTLGYSDSQDGLGILTGYSAGTGYDQATGLGSLNVANVVNAWPVVIGTDAATVTVQPGQASINSNNTLSVTVTVASSPSGGIAPTGTVTLTASGSTYSATSTLSAGGTATFTIPANSLPGSSAGMLDTLTAQYAGDVLYGAKTGTGTVTVTTVALLTPTVTGTPASTTLNSDASLNVTVTVAGLVITPTGSVTLTVAAANTQSGTAYTSTAQTLAATGSCTSASCTITIPANTLAAGTYPLTVSYSGDGTYAAASASTASVTVTESSFSLSQTAIAISPSTAISPGSSATATVTVSSTATYAGTVTLTCALQSTTAASGGDGATCTGGGAPGVTLTSGSSGTVVFTVGTTAAVASLERPKPLGNGPGWLGAGGGAVLAFVVFLGIPARRRSWRQMLGLLVLMMALGSLSACGSGGGSSSGGGQSDPGTLAGTYTFVVKGTATPAVTPAVSTTFTVTVN